MGPENSQSYQQVKGTLQRKKVPIVILNRDNFSQHIPNVNLAEGNGALVDITAGVLYADRALKTAQVQPLSQGNFIVHLCLQMNMKSHSYSQICRNSGKILNTL